MILDVYKDSLEYSIKDGMTLAKIGLMILLSFLIIPAFLLAGYRYRVIKTAINGMINGDETLPPVDDLTSMFIDGLKVTLVQIIYLILPILILLVVIFGSTVLSAISPAAGALFLVIGGLVGIILLIVCALAGMMAVTHMAANDGSIHAAFDIKEIFHIIKTIGWLRYIVYYIGIAIISSLIMVIGGICIAALLGVFGIISSVIPVASVALAVILGIITIIILLLIEAYTEIVWSRVIGLLYNMRE